TVYSAKKTNAMKENNKNTQPKKEWHTPRLETLSLDETQQTYYYTAQPGKGNTPFGDGTYSDPIQT
ncbi:MAG: hypothetical protein ACQESZ_05280, partial [Bacteroidota bacterium]